MLARDAIARQEQAGIVGATHRKARVQRMAAAEPVLTDRAQHVTRHHRAHCSGSHVRGVQARACRADRRLLHGDQPYLHTANAEGVAGPQRDQAIHHAAHRNAQRRAMRSELQLRVLRLHAFSRMHYLCLRIAADPEAATVQQQLRTLAAGEYECHRVLHSLASVTFTADRHSACVVRRSPPQ